MPKTKISEFSATPANNTDIDSINISEGCAPSGINDAIRELMSQLKDWQSGTSNDPMVIGSSGSLTLNQGTANGVAYLNGSKVVTSGSALTFNGTTLGITYANNSFVEGLNVTNSTNGANAQSRINITNSAGNLLALIQNSPSVNAGTAFVGTSSTQALTFGTSYTETMRLDSSGNLGLGVTPSAWDGSFKAFQVSNTSLFSQDSTGAGWWSKNARNVGGTWYYIGTGSASYIEQGAGAFKWNTAPSGTAGNAITFTQAMTLDASGNLGVGTTTPSSFGKLAVVGNASLNTNGQLKFYNSANNNWAFIDNPSTDGTAPLRFAPGGSEAMRLDGNGNLLVGTTSQPSSFRMFIDSGANSSVGIRSSASTYNAIIFYTPSTTTAGYIQISGSNTSYVTSSDYRLKNTIAPMTGALEKVALLKPCTYKWNADGSNGEGFIAHELAEVCPQAVSGEKDAVNEDGSIKPQGIDTSFLVATLTAAIQEQQAIIESLKARLDAANL